MTSHPNKMMTREGFIYLDIEHPVVAWNVYRGVLLARESIWKQHGHGAISMRVAGMFDSNDSTRMQSELAIDAIRATEFPSAVSRLSGLFVFDEVESALGAEQVAWGGHINSEYLTDVGISYRNATRLDANWITQMLNPDASLRSGWETLARAYWKGGPSREAPPIWELLIDGHATVWGTQLREQAYDVVKSRFPKSLGLLEESRIAAHLGFSLGHISSWLTKKGGRADLSFYFDNTSENDPCYLASVEEFFRTSPHLVNWSVLRETPGLAWLPDLTPYSKFLPIV